MHGKPQGLLPSLTFLGQGQGTMGGVTAGFVVLPCSLPLIAMGLGTNPWPLHGLWGLAAWPSTQPQQGPCSKSWALPCGFV